MQETPTTSPKKHRSRARFAIFASAVVVGAVLAGFGGAALYGQLFGAADSVVSREKVVMQQGEVVADVANSVSSSVVSIVTASSAQTMFGYSVQQQGAGTGIIISKDGYVVTNKHVVSDSSNIKIFAADGTQYEKVTLVGTDPTNDIAFLKIEGIHNLTPAKLGDSSQLQVGQGVVAIGNALGEYQNTVTTGIISALSRPLTASDGAGSTESLDNLLQTDAAINPGNSGGPLVNFAGEVVGINTAVASNAQGIGFAIPINDVKGMVKTLFATGQVKKAFVGVRYIPVTAAVVKQMNLSVDHGALLYANEGSSAVVAGGPADTAGLKDGDIITKVDATTVDSTHPFASVIAQYAPGDEVTISYVRSGKESSLRLTIGSQNS